MRSSASLNVKPGPWVTQDPIDVALNAEIRYSWTPTSAHSIPNSEKETIRWILEKTFARIVFEDLAKTKTGMELATLYRHIE